MPIFKNINNLFTRKSTFSHSRDHRNVPQLLRDGLLVPKATVDTDPVVVFAQSNVVQPAQEAIQRLKATIATAAAAPASGGDHTCTEEVVGVSAPVEHSQVVAEREALKQNSSLVKEVDQASAKADASQSNVQTADDATPGHGRLPISPRPIEVPAPSGHLINVEADHISPQQLVAEAESLRKDRENSKKAGAKYDFVAQILAEHGGYEAFEEAIRQHQSRQAPETPQQETGFSAGPIPSSLASSLASQQNDVESSGSSSSSSITATVTGNTSPMEGTIQESSSVEVLENHIGTGDASSEGPNDILDAVLEDDLSSTHTVIYAPLDDDMSSTHTVVYAPQTDSSTNTVTYTTQKTSAVFSGLLQMQDPNHSFRHVVEGQIEDFRQNLRTFGVQVTPAQVISMACKLIQHNAEAKVPNDWSQPELPCPETPKLLSPAYTGAASPCLAVRPKPIRLDRNGGIHPSDLRFNLFRNWRESEAERFWKNLEEVPVNDDDAFYEDAVDHPPGLREYQHAFYEYITWAKSAPMSLFDYEIDGWVQIPPHELLSFVLERNVRYFARPVLADYRRRLENQPDHTRAVAEIWQKLFQQLENNNRANTQIQSHAENPRLSPGEPDTPEPSRPLGAIGGGRNTVARQRNSGATPQYRSLSPGEPDTPRTSYHRRAFSRWGNAAPSDGVSGAASEYHSLSPGEPDTAALIVLPRAFGAIGGGRPVPAPTQAFESNLGATTNALASGPSPSLPNFLDLLTDSEPLFDPAPTTQSNFGRIGGGTHRTVLPPPGFGFTKARQVAVTPPRISDLLADSEPLFHPSEPAPTTQNNLGRVAGGTHHIVRPPPGFGFTEVREIAITPPRDGPASGTILPFPSPDSIGPNVVTELSDPLLPAPESPLDPRLYGDLYNATPPAPESHLDPRLYGDLYNATPPAPESHLDPRLYGDLYDAVPPAQEVVNGQEFTQSLEGEAERITAGMEPIPAAPPSPVQSQDHSVESDAQSDPGIGIINIWRDHGISSPAFGGHSAPAAQRHLESETAGIAPFPPAPSSNEIMPEVPLNETLGSNGNIENEEAYELEDACEEVSGSSGYQEASEEDFEDGVEEVPPPYPGLYVPDLPMIPSDWVDHYWGYRMIDHWVLNKLPELPRPPLADAPEYPIKYRRWLWMLVHVNHVPQQEVDADKDGHLARLQIKMLLTRYPGLRYTDGVLGHLNRAFEWVDVFIRQRKAGETEQQRQLYKRECDWAGVPVPPTHKLFYPETTGVAFTWENPDIYIWNPEPKQLGGKALNSMNKQFGNRFSGKNNTGLAALINASMPAASDGSDDEFRIEAAKRVEASERQSQRKEAVNKLGLALWGKACPGVETGQNFHHGFPEEFLKEAERLTRESRGETELDWANDKALTEPANNRGPDHRLISKEQSYREWFGLDWYQVVGKPQEVVAPQPAQQAASPQPQLMPVLGSDGLYHVPPGCIEYGR